MARAPSNKSHFTFNDTQLDQIGRENLSLLNRLARVATRPSGSGAPTTVKSSFEINRMRQAREIEESNLRLLRKLQSTKSGVRKEMGGTGGPTASRGFTVKRPPPRAPASDERPPWDGTLTGGLGSAPEHSRAGGPGGTRQFKSRDLKEIALEACPEKHLLRD